MNDHFGNGRQAAQRVLVVEDDESLRGLIVKSLTRAGYGVAGTALGADAIREVEGDPDLVLLLDQQLPDMTGRDIIVRLREEGVSPPFVVMTGQGDERLAVDMMKLGAADYLIKDMNLINMLPGVFSRLFENLETRRRLAEAEAALRESEARFRAMFVESPVSILIHDRDTAEIVDANPRACASYGLDTVDELKAYNIWLDPPYSVEEARANIQRAALEGPQLFEWCNRTVRGELFWEQISLISLVINGVERVMATAIDITERKMVEENLYRMSINDPLTGIYNRRYVLDRLALLIEEHQREGRSFSVVIIDLDHFKAINDTRGHLAGDFVLQHFASILKASFRPYDLVGRYGGEEFVVVAENIDMKQTERMITRMLERVRSHVFEYDGNSMKITFSAGIVNSEEMAPGFAVEKVIDRADERLYQAKKTGRDRVVCE
jgi:diguanylate cyclase (GGDEF)-like protein/PAS domain S-box-containing protein